MLTSRQKIVDYLKKHLVSTAGELSRAMQMTPANARHHLKILVDQGVVRQVGERNAANQRGRPEKIYRLADTLRQNNLGLLAGLLLRVIQHPGDPADNHQILQDLAEKMMETVGIEALPRSLGSRLVYAMQKLNQLHYQARWEARPGAPEIHFGQCPYQEIIAEHPELCQMDIILLQRMTGQSVEQIARLAPDRTGLRSCRFLIRSP